MIKGFNKDYHEGDFEVDAIRLSLGYSQLLLDPHKNTVDYPMCPVNQASDELNLLREDSE